MERGLTGLFVPQSKDGRDYECFIPSSLPPSPSVVWTPELFRNLTKAIESVSRLDGAIRLLPDLHLFLYSYIRKEAVLSSQIEGTQSSLSDLLMLESEIAPGVPEDDAAEVLRYVKALNEGIRRIRAGEAISLNMLLDLHLILLSTGRGSDKDPGQWRKRQNWIGGQTPDRAQFVPSPPENLEQLLGDLVNYWATSQDHTLVKAALAHVQFETIHPFRDGNGRIGRLLITLLLCKEKLISEPMVYLSLYFKENRDDYYKHLQAIRTRGDWENWLSFFFNGIAQITDSALEMTKKIQSQFDQDLNSIRKSGGRKSRGMLELFHALQQVPVLTISYAEEILKNSVSKPTLYTAANELNKIGILETKLNIQGVQVHIYRKYLDLLKV
jgi:Fic family protein